MVSTSTSSTDVGFYESSFEV